MLRRLATERRDQACGGAPRRLGAGPALIAALLVGLAVAALWAPPARAATITVTTTADELNTDGDCSLREALEAANTDRPVDACAAGNGADTILLPAGTYGLTLDGDGTTTGDLDIAGELTLAGAGITSTIIDGDGIDRVLTIYGDHTVTIAGLTIRGGDSNNAAGGGVRISESAVTFDRVRVTDNTSSYGIYLVGTASLNLVDSLVHLNTEGGIYTQTPSDLTVVGSTIAGNSGAANGGGIFSGGALTVVNSTISGNSTAGHGGGVYAGGRAAFFNATIADNTADDNGDGFGDGGGLYSLELAPSARDTLIAGNRDASPATQRPDCSGPLLSEGYNLIESTAGCIIQSGPGDITGASAGLGPLRRNGSDSLTHALAAGSPAIDAADPAGCLDQLGRELVTDQRGFVRPADGGGGPRCDIGAYEYNSPGAPTPTPTQTPTATPANALTATAQTSPSPTGTGVPGAPPATPTTAPAEGPPRSPRAYLPLIVQ